MASNVFMTFAWYAHLKNLADRPWYLAAVASWGIAFFEYLLQVPGNRIGYTQLILDRKSTRLNSSHSQISYAVFCLKKKKDTSLTTKRSRPQTSPVPSAI